MFGEKLRELRINATLSQEQLAEILDISQQAVGLWERNKNLPSKKLLLKIAEYFNVTTDFLLNDNKTSSSEADTSNQIKDSLQRKIESADKDTLKELEAYLDYITFKKEQQANPNAKAQ